MHPYIHAKNNPEKPAYIMAGSGTVITYGELNDRSNQAAQLFRSIGLRPGDHIALFMENNRFFMEIAWAAQRSGLIFTGISTHLNEEEAAYILSDCDARLLVTSASLSDTASTLLTAQSRVENFLMVDGVIDGYQAYESLVAEQPAEPIADETAGVDMLYSSGTTGRPKGIEVSLSGSAIEEMLPVMNGLAQNYGLDGDTVYLSPAPLYHAAPLRFNMLVMFQGGTCIIMEKFDEVAALELIEKYSVTHSQWVPIMFIRMLKLDLETRQRFDLSSQKVAIHAAAPCPREVKQQMIDWWGPIIHEYYSSTEGIGFTGLDSKQWLAHPGSVGGELVGTLHILGEDGEELPAGDIGTVYFSDGPNFSYYKDVEKTNEARNEKGWFSVGDVGYVDEDGFLYLTDRKAFLIISGGVNIYPQEAENLLIGHEKVADVAVFGVPNSEFGEEVKAVVQPSQWQEAGPALAQELIDYCKEHLSSIKCPRSIDFDQELPRYPNGKLYKRQVRDRYWPNES